MVITSWIIFFVIIFGGAIIIAKSSKPYSEITSQDGLEDCIKDVELNKEN